MKERKNQNGKRKETQLKNREKIEEAPVKLLDNEIEKVNGGFVEHEGFD